MVAVMSMTNAVVPGITLFGTVVMADGTDTLTDLSFSFTDGSIVPTTVTKSNAATADTVSGNIAIRGTGYYFNDASHGCVFLGSNTIEINVAGPGTLYIEGCNYNPDTNITVTGTDYSCTKSFKGSKSNGPSSCGVMTEFDKYTGGAGTLTISLNNYAYIPKIEYKYQKSAAVVPLETPVLDKVYSENFAATTLSRGTSVDKTKIFDDTVYFNTPNGVAWDGGHGYKFSTGDEFKINVAGNAEISLGMCAYSDGGSTAELYNQNGDKIGELNTRGDSDGKVASFVYSGGATPNAPEQLTLKFTGKNVYIHNFSVVSYTTKSVAISGCTTPDYASVSTVEYTIYDKTADAAAAVITADSSVNLAVGHTYEVSSSDPAVIVTVSGTQGNTFTVSDSTSAVALALEKAASSTVSGSFITKGGAPVTNLSPITAIQFKHKESGALYDGTITDTGYTASLNPGEYETIVTSTSYTTSDRVSVAEGSNTNDVYLVSQKQTKFILPEVIKNAESYGFAFTKAEANNDTSICLKTGGTITVPVSGKQKVTVAGWYSGDWNINGAEGTEGHADSGTGASAPATSSYTTNGTETSVTVNITSSPTYLYWISVEDAADFKSELTVPGDYATVTDAIAAVKKMNRPSGEAGRVTITLTDNITEQIVVDAPYITINGDNTYEINWYYGFGYKYYSAGSDGLFDEALFYDKYEKHGAKESLWGGVVIVRGDHFVADSVTIKNTFNYELTNKEVLDGVEPVSGYSNGKTMPDRTAEGADVTSRAYTERSNALYIEADDVEITGSSILSSQDTLGRNGDASKNYHVYAANSVIGGNVDYICGDFYAVFDDCTLLWKSYGSATSENENVGYIAAPRTKPYIFYNCQIGSDGDGNSKGLYGRTWSNGSTAFFQATQTNGLINAAGWGRMSVGDSGEKFYELNNLNGNDAFVSDDSGKAAKSELTQDIINAYATNAIIADGGVLGYDPENVAFTSRWGDLNCDGITDRKDAQTALKYVSGIATVIAPANYGLSETSTIKDVIDYMQEY